MASLGAVCLSMNESDMRILTVFAAGMVLALAGNAEEKESIIERIGDLGMAPTVL